MHKPVVIDLSSDNLLKRYLHRQTQKNSEENINKIILKGYKKDNKKDDNVGQTILEIGLVFAFISFSDCISGIY